MEIFVTIKEQKLKAVLTENSRALALYKELEKGDIIINASDYGGFEKSGKLYDANRRKTTSFYAQC